MFDLVRDILLTTLAVAKTTSVFHFKIRGSFNIRCILVLLATETLVDKVEEDALREIRELAETLYEFRL